MTWQDRPLGVAPSIISDLRARVASRRRPSPPVRGPWYDGVDHGLVEDLAERWSTTFDWEARERSLNGYRHVHVPVDGVILHAMMAEPPVAGSRLAVLALHGWPSTFEQMTRIADRLTTRGHPLVAPSLPGFGFSSAPVDPGWDLVRSARALHELMLRLGYQRYLVRGTDYGLAIALHLGALFPRHVAGVHIGGTHLAVPDDHELPVDLSDDEKRFVESARNWYATESGYVAVQSTKPETLAHALTDSPVGLLAWIVEKYRTWCATPEDVYATFAPDDILSTATIYWATNSVASSLRLYREDRLTASCTPTVRVPLAVNQPALEEYLTPEEWWRRWQPLVRYTRLPDAAHFPEWEAPEALVDDLLGFAEQL